MLWERRTCSRSFDLYVSRPALMVVGKPRPSMAAASAPRQGRLAGGLGDRDLINGGHRGGLGGYVPC